MCIQIDIKQPLVPAIGKDHVQHIQYKGIEFCFDCGLIGHNFILVVERRKTQTIISTSDPTQINPQSTLKMENYKLESKLWGVEYCNIEKFTAGESKVWGKEQILG